MNRNASNTRKSLALRAFWSVFLACITCKNSYYLYCCASTNPIFFDIQPIMCGECIVLRAQNFLIVSGAIAMLGVIVILIVLLAILLRFRKSLSRLDAVIKQVEMVTHLPIKLLEHRLNQKLDDK